MKKPIIPLKLPSGAGGFPSIIPPLGVRGLSLWSWGLLLLILATACRRDPPEPEPDLPPETQEGKDTFGCYLNGVPWKPSQKEWGNNTLYVQFDGTYFALYAKYNEGEKFERIDFFSDKVSSLREGEYPIKKSLGFDNRANFWDLNKNIRLMSMDADVVDDGVLTITKFDLNKKFVSGRFWFKLQKGDAKYEATEGRFDISF